MTDQKMTDRPLRSKYRARSELCSELGRRECEETFATPPVARDGDQETAGNCTATQAAGSGRVV